MPGYQIRSCAGYKLPYDNGGEPYRWISNFQVISAVQMNKHRTLPGQIWSMRPAELQTVARKFKDMRQAGARPVPARPGPRNSCAHSSLILPVAQKAVPGRAGGRWVSRQQQDSSDDDEPLPV